jgi:hypothetical protein
MYGTKETDVDLLKGNTPAPSQKVGVLTPKSNILLIIAVKVNFHINSHISSASCQAICKADIFLRRFEHNPQPLPLLKPLVVPVPSLEMGRVVSGRASGKNSCLSTPLLNTDG